METPKTQRLKLRHLIGVVVLSFTASAGGMYLGSVLASSKQFTKVETAITLPETVVSPEKSDPMFQFCNDHSMKASAIMFDRQYRNIDMAEAGLKSTRIEDGGETFRLTSEAYTFPVGSTEDDRDSKIIMFGMKKFSDCVAREVSK